MIFKIASYRVRPGEIAAAKDAISALIENVRTNEFGTLRYEVFQMRDQVSFLHLMAFEDQNADTLHQGASHVRAFAERLAGICDDPPRFTQMGLEGSIALHLI